MTTGWIILGVVVVVVLWAITIYNGLVALRQRANQAFADIDVQLKQRHDLIPNLVETVKGYAAHETRHARSRGPGAQCGDRRARHRAEGRGRKHADRRVAQIVRAVRGLSGPQGQPRTSSSCRAKFRDIENKLAASRRFFNNAVQEYNTGIEQFPAAVFAGMFGFGHRTFFDLGERPRASSSRRRASKFYPCVRAAASR